METPEIHGEFRATHQQYTEFSQSSVWQDMKQEIAEWLEDVRDHMEETIDLQTLGHYQGIAMACRRFLSLPEQFVEAQTHIVLNNTDEEEN